MTSSVNELKKSITLKNEIFNKIKNNQFRPNEQNENFFKSIEDSINLYNTRATTVQQGNVFYSDFFKRIDDLHSNIKDYILSRDIQKKDLIEAIQSGINYETALGGIGKEFNLFIFNYLIKFFIFNLLLPN